MGMTGWCDSNGPHASRHINRVTCGVMVLGVIVVCGILQSTAMSLANGGEIAQEESIEGEITLIAVDAVNLPDSGMIYLLERRATAEVFELTFNGRPPQQFSEQLQTGNNVRVRGRRVAHQPGDMEQKFIVSDVVAVGGNSTAPSDSRK